MILGLSLGIYNIYPGTCYSAKMCEVLKKKKKAEWRYVKGTQESMERIPNGWRQDNFSKRNK